MADLAALKVANAARWGSATLLKAGSFKAVAQHLVDAKQRYRTVSSATGVPWWFVAVVHERECSQSWTGSLAQGDRWDHVSVHVPAGRGPFASWEAAAIDALTSCAPYAARNKDWSIGSALTLLETYNGLGYANRNMPSPYLWSGTDQYKSGKYVRDGVFDPAAIDVQLGCAGLLWAMMDLDKTIAVDLTKTALAPRAAVASGAPSITNPAPGSIGAWVASLFRKGK